MNHFFLHLAIVFHAPVALLALIAIWDLARRLRLAPAAWRTMLIFAAETIAIGAVAFFWATFLVARTGSGGFAWMRLIAQALFGEGVLICLAACILLTARRSRWGIAPALCLLALLCIYYEGYHHGPYDLRLTSHRLTARSGSSHGVLRIVHLSDIQSWRVGEHERRALRLAREARPDIVLITGDFVHERLPNTGMQVAHDLSDIFEQEGLRPPLGTYAVAGDNENMIPGIRMPFEARGIRFLENETARMRLPNAGTLDLIGLAAGTSRNGDRRTIDNLMAALPPENLHIIMGHAPDYVMSLPNRARVDLALAGHTHGGQVVIPGYGPLLTLSRLPRRYAAGLNDYQGVPLHVTRGVGMERGFAPQVRFLCPPEVCLLALAY